MRWIAYAVETETLMGEITDATGRIANLVGAARQYSQLDRAPFDEVDLRVLLKSTLMMMSRKLEGIQLVKELRPRPAARSRRTPPSSTRCGPTSSTTPSAP